MKKLNNKELLELLKNDAQAFNEYRREYKDQIIDFSDMNPVIKRDKYIINLDNIKMNKSGVFVGVDNDKTTSYYCDIYKFNSCDLSDSVIRICNNSDVYFNNCNLSNTIIEKLSYSFDHEELCFIDCNMSRMCFSGFKLIGIRFDYSDLNEVNFYDAKIENCSFFNVKNLDKVNISDKQLSLNYYQRYKLNTNNNN